MRITKYTHACVRLEHEGRVLVIDPGVWSEPSALRGADAVLLTHEHADHVDPLRLAALGVPVYAPEGANLGRLPTVAVQAGARFSAAGFTVLAVGGRHTTIYNGLPDCPNLGYLVDERVYHPGDSVHPPGQPVHTLLVPLQGSWLKLHEAIEFVQAIAPERAIGIHDAQLNEWGLSSVNGWLAETCQAYRWLRTGESCDKLPA